MPGALDQVEPVDVLVGALLLDHEHRRPQREHVVQRGDVEVAAADLGPGELAGCHGGILACSWSTGRVRFGVHLPLMDLGGPRWGVEALVEYAETATCPGLRGRSAPTTTWCSARRGWTGPPHSQPSLLRPATPDWCTTVANPVVRGPAALAKTLAALDVLSGGRVVAGLGPGSSARDYEVAGVPFEERWPRFDDALAGDGGRCCAVMPYEGRFYQLSLRRSHPCRCNPEGSRCGWPAGDPATG